MLFRGGGIGHTWKHNTSKANRIVDDLYGQLGVTRTGFEAEDDEEEVTMGVDHETTTAEEGAIDAAEYLDSDWEDDDMNMETD